MPHPFISIIIPVYKVEPYLRECLESVLAWRFADWEAILVDDGSPDGCGAICDEYAASDPRFRAVHKTNEGVAAARNTGLDMARGEWCWFVDSDDVIDPDTPVLSELLRDKDLVMFGIKNYNDGDAIPRIEENTSWNEYDDTDTFFRRHVSYLHPTMWYHRRFWASDSHAIRFTKGIRLGEDGEFMRKCEFLSNSPLKVNHTSYYYRLRQGSATHHAEKTKIVVDDAFAVMQNMLNFIRTKGITTSDWKTCRLATIAKSIPVHTVKGGLWNGATRKAFKQLVDAFKTEGFDMTNDRTIRLATSMPNIYWLITKLRLGLKR